MRGSGTLISFHPMFVSPVNHSSSIYPHRWFICSLGPRLASPFILQCDRWLWHHSWHFIRLSSCPLCHLCLVILPATLCLPVPYYLLHNDARGQCATPQLCHYSTISPHTRQSGIPVASPTMFLGHKSSDTSKGQSENVFVYVKRTKYARLYRKLLRAILNDIYLVLCNILADYVC